MKNKTKVLSIVLVIVTLLSLVSIPASAAIGYPMAVTIYYKNESGAQLPPPIPKQSMRRQPLSHHGLHRLSAGMS